MKRFQNAFRKFFGKKNAIESRNSALPIVSERTSIEKILVHYPRFESFLHDRYRVTLSRAQTKIRFGNFARANALPPAQVVFMEYQMSERTRARGISALDLKRKLSEDPRLIVIDARESWERTWGSLPRSRVLDVEMVEKELDRLPKDTPIAVVCHFGVRSMDAAAYLSDRGFEDVRALTGGVEAWSLEADPSFPRYPGHPC